jgi:type I restriction enzyme S subunit
LVLLQRGFDITKAAQKPGEVPVISSSGVGSYHDTAMANGPGVVVGRKGTVGVVHFVANDYWPHDTTLWSKDLRGNDARYVYYFLQTLGLQRFDVGNSNPTLNRNHIHKLPVAIPPASVQVQIASKLVVFDNLIENNRRRVALLEQSARLLYRDWFVHLRFPGHEHVKVMDGVPEGWERLPFSALADYVNGYPFKPAELFSEGLPIIKIPELRDGATEKTPRNPGGDIPEKYSVKDRDLLFSWSGTLLVSFWHQGSALLNQHLFRVDPLRACGKEFLFFAINEAMPAFANQTTGATMKHIRKSALDSVTTLCPDGVLMREIQDCVEPTFDLIHKLIQTNDRLRAARDLLLPRLMSGALVV